MDSYGSPPSVSSKGSSTPASDRRLPSQRVGVDPGADRGPSYGQRSPSGAGGSSLANLEHRAGGGAGHSRHAPAGTTLPAPVRSSVGERGKMETFIHPVSVWSFLSREMKSHRDDMLLRHCLLFSLFSLHRRSHLCDASRPRPDRAVRPSPRLTVGQSSIHPPLPRWTRRAQGWRRTTGGQGRGQWLWVARTTRCRGGFCTGRRRRVRRAETCTAKLPWLGGRRRRRLRTRRRRTHPASRGVDPRGDRGAQPGRLG